MDRKATIITKFDDCFGSVLDHETIKDILSNVHWDTEKAFAAISSFIDIDNASEDLKLKIRSFNVQDTSFLNTSTNNLFEAPTLRSNFTKNLCPIDNRKYDWARNTSESSKKVNNSQKFDCRPPYEESTSSDRPKKVNNTSGAQSLNDESSEVARVLKICETCDKVFIILRGLPGSGKSTLAAELVKRKGEALSTDDYFILPNGTYLHQFDKIRDAHAWNQNRSREAILKKVSPIVIDNTNLVKWEMEIYVKMAHEADYHIEFLEPETPWRYQVSSLARKTIHGVPRFKINEMQFRFEKNISLSTYGLLPKRSGLNDISDIHLSNIKIFNDIANQNNQQNNNVKSAADMDSSLQIINNIGSESILVDSQDKLRSNSTLVPNVESFVDTLNVEPSQEVQSENLSNISSTKQDKIFDAVSEQFKAFSPFKESFGSRRVLQDSAIAELGQFNDNFGKISDPPQEMLNDATSNAENFDESFFRNLTKTSSHVLDASELTKNLSEAPSDCDTNVDQSKPLPDIENVQVNIDASNVCTRDDKELKVDMECNNTEESNHMTAAVNQSQILTKEEILKRFANTGAIPKRLNVNRSPSKNDNLRSPNRISNNTFDVTNMYTPPPLLADYSSILVEKVNVAVQTQVQQDFSFDKVLYGNASGFVSSNLTGFCLLVSEQRSSHSSVGTMTQEFVDQLDDFNELVRFDQTQTLQDVFEKCDEDTTLTNNLLSFKDTEGSFMKNNDFSSHLSLMDDTNWGYDDNLILAGNSTLFKTPKNKPKRKKTRNPKSIDIFSHKSNRKTEAEDVSSSKSSSNSTSLSSSPQSSMIDEVKNVSIELDPLFAIQLVNIFGPVANLGLEYSYGSEDLKASLPLSLCKDIHNHWNNTMCKRLEIPNDDTTVSDEALALKIHEEEMLLSKQDAAKSSNKNVSANNPPTDFRQIMELEKASDRNNTRKNNSIARKLSEEQLCSKFPSVSKDFLMELLENYKGNFNALVEHLSDTFGPSKSVSTSFASAVMAPAMTEMELSQGSATQDLCQELEPLRQWVSSSREAREGLMASARMASGPQRGSVAGHYLNEAARCSRELKIAESSVSKAINARRTAGLEPNTLDLHFLTVSCALETLVSFLGERRRVLEEGRGRGGTRRAKLQVITGWGRHSNSNTGQIKLVVEQHLKKHSYKYYCDNHKNPGMLVVFISC